MLNVYIHIYIYIKARCARSVGSKCNRLDDCGLGTRTGQLVVNKDWEAAAVDFFAAVAL